MKHLPLLLLAVALGFAAEDGPRPPARPDAPENRANFRPPVQLSPEEQKRLHEAMEKARLDPAVKEAHEQAAKAQQAAMEAQKKAREVTDEAARKADPEVAPILEKIRKAMEQPHGVQPNRQPNAEGPRTHEGGDRTMPNSRGAQFPGLTPEEQRHVREALAKANAEPAVREAREAAAVAQRKAMEIAEDAARKSDPSVAPLLEKMRKAGEARRAEGEGQRGRKQPE